MLPAIGAASAALDAIQSLTSPQPGSSSQSTDFFGSFSDAGDSSAASSAQSTVSGFSSAQISSDNLNALFDAQSLSSGNAAGAEFQQFDLGFIELGFVVSFGIRHGLIGLQRDQSTDTVGGDPARIQSVLRQRLTRHSFSAGYPKRSCQAGSAPGSGKAVAA